MKYDSPLLFPVKRHKDHLRVLDETLLPHQETYTEVRSLDQALYVLGSMKTRAMGQVLLFFYCCILFKESVSIDQVVARFHAVRPTFDFALLGKILVSYKARGIGLEEAADTFLADFDKARIDRCKRLAHILPSPAFILSICNVNGELLYLYSALKGCGKKASFYICETRPYLQGTRLTFWELAKNNIPCRLLCDNQAAFLMKEARINAVVTGADRSSQQGGIINKIGTYGIACLSRYYKIPFYPLTQYPNDIALNSIPIEERNMQEAFMFLEGDYSKTEALYPSFDIVENEFITQPIELAL